jgi:formate hydrogenlyase subunit 4
MNSKLTLAFGAVLLAPFIGGLIRGVDRVMTARMQGRQGPPLLQPFYDILKLLRKERVVVNSQQVLYAYMHLALMALSLFMLCMGQDALMLLFILAFSTLSLVMGGMSVRSPFSRIGAQREIMMMVAYEPILILMIIGFYLVNGNFQVQAIFDSQRPLLFSMPLLFLAYLTVVMIKLQKSPFDLATSHHAHQEIVKGLTLEFAGPYLGVIEIAHCYETAFFLGLVGLFWITNLYMAAALMACVFVLSLLVDNLCARLTTIWMFRFMWTVALGLALTNIVWLYWR